MSAVAVGKAGVELEGNIDVAIAWFPFSQGWLGGYVAPPRPLQYSASSRADWTTLQSRSLQLPTDANQVAQRDSKTLDSQC